MTAEHDALFRAWRTASEAAGGLLDSIEQHAAALRLLEAVWEAKAGHPELGSLLGLLAGHIAAYEERVFPPPSSLPHRVLAFLMEQQSVAVVSLAQVTGIAPEELALLLSGQRDLTCGQMHVLAQHLHVNPQVFV